MREYSDEELRFMYKKDGGSPDTRLRLAHLRLARLGLNDGAKLCMGFLETLFLSKYQPV